MDALGIFWIVLWSIIVIVSFIKLRIASSPSNKTANQDNNDSHKSYCIGGITESYQRISKLIPFLKHRRNKCRNSTNDKTGECDYEDSFNHGKASIASSRKTSQSQQRRTLSWRL